MNRQLNGRRLILGAAAAVLLLVWGARAALPASGGPVVPVGPAAAVRPVVNLLRGGVSCYPEAARLVIRSQQAWLDLLDAHLGRPHPSNLYMPCFLDAGSLGLAYQEDIDFSGFVVVVIFSGPGGRPPVITRILRDRGGDVVHYVLESNPAPADMRPHHFVRTRQLGATVGFVIDDQRQPRVPTR
jgi:hypothetical protein